MRKLLAVILGLLLIVFSCTGCLFAVDPVDTYETQIEEIPQSKKISTSVQLDAEIIK